MTTTKTASEMTRMIQELGESLATSMVKADREVCPHCAHVHHKEYKGKFCMSCGLPIQMEIVCLMCDQKNSHAKEGNFCAHCGERLVSGGTRDQVLYLVKERQFKMGPAIAELERLKGEETEYVRFKAQVSAWIEQQFAPSLATYTEDEDGSYQILVLYANNKQDNRLFEEFRAHMVSVLRLGSKLRLMDINNARLAGDCLQSYREFRIQRANLFVVLASSELLASQELIPSLRGMMKRKETVRIVPVQMRPCVLERSPLEPLQMLPRDKVAVSKKSDRDDGWCEVVQELRAVLEATGVLPKTPSRYDW